MWKRQLLLLQGREVLGVRGGCGAGLVFKQECAGVCIARECVSEWSHESGKGRPPGYVVGRPACVTLLTGDTDVKAGKQ